jgi:hypothetical protein
MSVDIEERRTADSSPNSVVKLEEFAKCAIVIERVHHLVTHEGTL